MRATSIRTDESATFGPERLTEAVITCPFDTMRLTRIVTFKGRNDRRIVSAPAAPGK